jgi:hypothetical protein
VPIPSRSNKGRKNIFVCKVCRGHIVTVDADEGSTPLAIGCHATLGCTGKMASSLYNVFDQTIAAAYEWYRPGVLQILKPSEAAYVAGGGLLLRFVENARPEGVALTMGLAATLRHIQGLASSTPPPEPDDAEAEGGPAGNASGSPSALLAEIARVCGGALSKVPHQ